jgi:hypothetical protein
MVPRGTCSPCQSQSSVPTSTFSGFRCQSFNGLLMSTQEIQSVVGMGKQYLPDTARYVTNNSGHPFISP